MFFPIRTDSPLKRTPYVNYGLLALCLGAHVAALSSPRILDMLALSGSSPKLYQFITYQFMHGSWGHLLGNLLFLYIFGNNVNDRLGHVGYLAFYLAGGVASAAAFLLVEPDSPGLVGASGSIAAVMGAFLVLLPRTHITVIYFLFFVGVIELPSLFVVPVFFLKDVFLQMAGAKTEVAHFAHIGGTVFGAAVGFAMLALGLLPRDPLDMFGMAKQWNRRRVYRDVVTKGYDPFNGAGGVGVPPAVKAADAQRMAEIGSARALVGDYLSAGNLNEAAAGYDRLLAMDSSQVLARNTQLHLGMALQQAQRYAEAARVFEQFLEVYGKGRMDEETVQIELMLGILYARYIPDRAKATAMLNAVLPKLHSERQIAMARDALAQVAAT